LYVSIIKNINERQDNTVQWISIKSLKTEIQEATPYTITITTFSIKVNGSERLQLPEAPHRSGEMLMLAAAHLHPQAAPSCCQPVCAWPRSAVGPPSRGEMKELAIAVIGEILLMRG